LKQVEMLFGFGEEPVTALAPGRARQKAQKAS
jgi:hypothetical protein